MNRALKGEACSSPATGLVRATQRRTSGQHDSLPQERDVQRSVIIGVAPPRAGGIGTREPLPRAVADVEATVAHLRGESRVDQDKGYAHRLTLVGQERPELMKGPTVGPSPLRLIPGLSVRALPDAGQIFAGDSLFGRDGLPHDVLAHDMVGVCLEAMFPPRYPFLDSTYPAARATSALRSLALETAARGCVAVTHRRHVRAAKRHIIACMSDISSSQVYSKDASGIHGRRVSIVGADQQAPAALAVADQVRFRELHGILEHLPLMPADAQLNLEPTIKRRDAGAVMLHAVQARRIETHSGILPERVDALSVGLIRRRHHSDSPNRVLRHQPVVAPHGLVRQTLQAHLVKLLSIPRHAADIVARRVEPLLQACEGGFLARSRPQGQGDGPHAHTPIIPDLRLECSQETRRYRGPSPVGDPIPPRLERRGGMGSFR